MKLNICMLLRPDFRPHGQIYPQIGICSYLTKFGHSVTWVTWAEKSTKVESFFFNDIHVYSTPHIHYLGGSSLLIKILNILPNTFRRMRLIPRIFKEGKYDIIFVSDFVFDGMMAAYIKWRYNVPFILALTNPLEQDWESFKIDPRWSKLPYYLYTRINTLITKRLLYYADLILPISKWFKNHLVLQGFPEAKIMPGPNGVDMSVFSNREGATVRDQYHLGDSTVFIYVGTLVKARYLDTLIKACTEVKKERANVKLLVVGRGNDEENLKLLAYKLGIGNDVIFTGVVPQSNVPNYIEAADIGVSPVPPLSFYKLSSPIKLFEYMAMAKPVVANLEIPEHSEVLTDSEAGILVSHTPEAFAHAMIELLDNPDKAKEMGQKGRDWIIKHNSFEVLSRQIERRYIELVQNKSKWC